MPTRKITLQFERRLLEHRRAYHIRRMRFAIWLYLDILSRLPEQGDTVEIEPAQVARDMGLPEGTLRSWLGHLKRLRYLRAERLDGNTRLRVGRLGLPERQPGPKERFFTLRKLERALGEPGNTEQLEEALRYPDDVLRRALAGAQAVPEGKIRKSRTALFTYLVKRYAEESKDSSRS